MEELLRIREFRRVLALGKLHVQHRHVKVIDISPGLVLRHHDVALGVGEWAALVQLRDGVFGGVAEAAPDAGEERDAGGLGED